MQIDKVDATPSDANMIRYFVDTPVAGVNYCTLVDLVVVFALFVFMLALLCFCVAIVFSENKDLYKQNID